MLLDIYVLIDDGDRSTLGEFGLTSSQFGVLLLLNLNQGIRLATLADRLLVARSTITRIVDQLEDAGFIKRLNDPSDRRAQHVVLTPEGVELKKKAQKAHHQSLKRRLTVLEPAEIETLNVLLDKLRHGLREDLDRRNGR
jgi:DNA-binding MarR family transcriptional regulator